MFPEHLPNQRHGQSDNVRVVSFDPRDPAGSDALDGVSPGLIHGFSGSDIAANLAFGERIHGDEGSLRTNVGKETRAPETDRRDYPMRTPGEQAQHAAGIGLILGLPQDLPVDDDYRIGAQDKVVEPGFTNRRSFLPSQAFGKSTRLLAWLGDFWNIDRVADETDPGTAQKLLPAGRRGSKNQH